MAQPLILTLRITADGRRLVTEVLRAEGALEQLAAAEGKAAREAERASAETARMGAEATAAAGRLGRLGAALRRAFEGRRHLIQQVAFQLQDVVTQLQLGAPAAQVLAVQGGQIAQAFGPLGTILGAAAGAVLGLAGAFFSLRQEVEPTIDLLDETVGTLDDLASRARKYADALDRATGALRRHMLARAAEESRQLLATAPVSKASEILASRIRERLFREDRMRFLGGGGQVRLARAVRERVRAFEGRLRAALEAGDRQKVADILGEVGLLGTDVADELIRIAGQIKAARLAAEGRTKALRELAGGREGRGAGGGSGGGGGSGSGRRDLARDVLADLAFEVDVRERLLRAIRAGADAYEEETARIEAERIARRAGIDLQSQEFRQLLDLVRTRRSLSELLEDEEQRRRKLAAAARDQLEAERREAERAARELERVSREIAGSIARGFLDAARGVRSFGDVAEEVLSRLAERMLELRVVQPLEDGLTRLLNGFLGSLFGTRSSGGSVSYAQMANAIYAAGTSPFAKGGVLEGGEVLRFARGGVVDRPVLFPLRRGAGLMGEAGPEAILPLTRLPDGRLGVAAAGREGDGLTVNVRVVDARGADTDTVAATVRRTGPDALDIDLVVLDSVRRLADSGRLDDVLGPRTGLRRKLV